MNALNGPPNQSQDDEAEPPSLPDPRTGEPLRVGDVRAEFERISRGVPRDPEAERAFIEGKIEMVRTDPHLSATEKERAIEELQRLL